MINRRRLITTTAAVSIGTFAGCTSDSENGSDNNDSNDEYAGQLGEPTTVIFIAPKAGNSYDVDIQGDPRNAESIEYRLDGEEIFTLYDNTHRTTVETGAKEGETVEAIAVYEDGTEEVIDERCISC